MVVINHPIEQVLGAPNKMDSNSVAAAAFSFQSSNPVASAHHNMQSAVFQVFSSIEKEYNNMLLLVEVLRRELQQEQDKRKNLEAENHNLRQQLQIRVSTPPSVSAPLLMPADVLPLPVSQPLDNTPTSTCSPVWVASMPGNVAAVVKRPSSDPFALTPNHIKAIGTFLKEVETIAGAGVVDDRNKQLIALFDQDRVEDALLQAALGMKRHKDPIQNPAAFLNRTLTNLLQQEHQPPALSQGFELFRPVF